MDTNSWWTKAGFGLRYYSFCADTHFCLTNTNFVQQIRHLYEQGPSGLPQADTKAGRSHRLQHVFVIGLGILYHHIWANLDRNGVSGVGNMIYRIFI